MTGKRKMGENMNDYASENRKLPEFALTFFTYLLTVYALSDFHILHLRKEV